ncbi:MAG: hypothetical protein DI603_10935 [Roseateles depolymerans]|uniref:Uncharacterized protein n=1 Tax=Roseateles depolymerans TaxID=76731 RepID=A0A2W5DKW8_9BURK|nr:MAG: hypothetical protein DI603_10935 [Roseateles depolymerans]
MVTNGAWLYRAFDQAVTEGYRRHERYENANRLVAASTLASEAVRGRSKQEAEALLRRLFPSEQVFEKEDALRTIWLEMPLNADGSVVGVTIAPGTRAQAQSATVGNEAFYPAPANAASRQ